MCLVPCCQYLAVADSDPLGTRSRNLRAVVLRVSASKSPGGPFKHRSLDPSPRVPDLRILGVGEGASENLLTQLFHY